MPRRTARRNIHTASIHFRDLTHARSARLSRVTRECQAARLAVLAAGRGAAWRTGARRLAALGCQPFRGDFSSGKARLAVRRYRPAVCDLSGPRSAVPHGPQRRWRRAATVGGRQAQPERAVHRPGAAIVRFQRSSGGGGAAAAPRHRTVTGLQLLHCQRFELLCRLSAGLGCRACHCDRQWPWEPRGDIDQRRVHAVLLPDGHRRAANRRTAAEPTGRTPATSALDAAVAGDGVRRAASPDPGSAPVVEGKRLFAGHRAV
ncbi:hypothetical protein SSTU70S_04807 [Stutzerimonas stutzeri]